MGRASQRRLVVGITGATGYIGRRLTEAALARGHTLWCLGRRDPQMAGVHFHPFDLASAVSPLPDLDVLIHLAAVTGPAAEEESGKEVQAAQALFDAAPAGCRFLFVSSQVASDEAPSAYGRTKARIEQLVLSRGGSVVRPGLVYGGAEQGLFGRLSRACARLPILPRFIAPTPIVRPIHADDLVPIILLAAEGDEAGIVNALGPPVTFTHFLRTLARERHRRRPFFLPVPIHVLASLIRIVERLTGRPHGSAQLRSLARNPHLPSSLDAAELRPLDEGLARSVTPVRRRSIEEAHLLMRYLLKARPSPSLISQYVRQAEARGMVPIFRTGRHSGLSIAALVIADCGRSSNLGIRDRLLLALRICEASPQGFARMLKPARVPGGRRLLTLIGHLAASAGTEILAVMLRPFALGWCRRHLLCESGRID